MRMRLGLLQDRATIDRQIAREAAEAQAKKHKHNHPTVKTEAQSKIDEVAANRDKDRAKEAAKDDAKATKAAKRRIKPLSEAVAIETGANFVAETFVFSVALGVLFLQDQWSKSKQSSKDEEEAEALAALKADNKTYRTSVLELEKEVLRLRAKDPDFKGSHKRLLPKELWDQEGEDIEIPEPKKSLWSSMISSWPFRARPGQDERPTPAPPSFDSQVPPKKGSEVTQEAQGATTEFREQSTNKTTGGEEKHKERTDTVS